MVVKIQQMLTAMLLTPLSVCGCSGFDSTPGGGSRAGVKIGTAADCTELINETMVGWPVADRAGGRF